VGDGSQRLADADRGDDAVTQANVTLDQAQVADVGQRQRRVAARLRQQLA
jgi:hypothetical protein